MSEVKFKVGDKVRLTTLDLGIGVIVEPLEGDCINKDRIPVKWAGVKYTNDIGYGCPRRDELVLLTPLEQLL